MKSTCLSTCINKDIFGTNNYLKSAKYFKLLKLILFSRFDFNIAISTKQALLVSRFLHLRFLWLPWFGKVHTDLHHRIIVQSNVNGSNIFGTMEICSRYGLFEPLRFNHGTRSG